MKKIFLAILLIFTLQILTLLVTFEVLIYVMPDCSSEWLSWQCTTGSGPVTADYFSVLIVPPLLAKFLLNKFGMRIAWKKIIAIHLILIFLWWLVLTQTETQCGCGG
ncbi:MAG TPA: hypothetical protein VIJ68_02560 [Candidatus Saccharimonadales bacterium]